MKWYTICLSVLIYMAGIFLRENPKNYQWDLQFLEKTGELFRKQAYSDQLICAQNPLGNIISCFDRI